MCVSGWGQFLAPSCCVFPGGDFSHSWGSGTLEAPLGASLSDVDPRGPHKAPPRGPCPFLPPGASFGGEGRGRGRMLVCFLCPAVRTSVCNYLPVIANRPPLSLTYKPEPGRHPREHVSLIVSPSRSPFHCSLGPTPLHNDSHISKSARHTEKAHGYVTPTRYQKISPWNPITLIPL